MKVHYKATERKALLSMQTSKISLKVSLSTLEVMSIGLKASLPYRYRHNSLSLTSQLWLKKHLQFKDLEKFRSGLKVFELLN